MRVATRYRTPAAIAALIIAMTCYSNDAVATVIAATKTAILVWIAEDQGYFDAIPGGVRVESYDSGTMAARDLTSGKVDLATSSEFAFGSNVVNHPELRVLAAISASRTCHLFTRAESGIESISDLRNRRIGITRKSIGQYFLGQLLTLEGIRTDDVEMINLRPAEIAEGVASGTIDAGMTWEPYVYEAKKKVGDAFRLIRGDDERYYYFLLTSTSPWLAANPETAAGIVQALHRAERFAAANPEEAKAIITRNFVLEPAYVEQLWPQHTLKVTLPQDLLFVIEEGIRWRMEEGLATLSDIPDILRYIYLSALESVSAGDVGIIR